MHNTRISNLNLKPFYPEIEHTLFRLRKNKQGAIVSISEGSEFDDLHSDYDNSEFSEKSDKSFIMAGTIIDLTAPDLTHKPLCITYPPLGENGTFELKSGFIHQLATCNGLSGEDPNKHWSDFHIVCSTMKPATVTDEQLKLRAFPFFRKDSSRDWLYYLPPASIDTWVKMKKAFLEKYFHASRASQLKKEISNTEQRNCETMYEYLERFRKLCATCPYHGYTAQELVMYFCGGLCMEDARTVCAACGGKIVNKSLPEAWTIIGELAESSRDFARKYAKPGVNSVGSSSSNLEEKVDNLTSLFKDMMSGQRTAMVCGICSDAHPNEHYPLMQEGPQEEVNGVWESTPKKKWDPYSNTSISVQNLPPTQPPPSVQMSTEDMIRALVTCQATLQATVIQNQKENKASIQNIENELGQMATTINRLEARDSNVLPSQTVVYQKNVSVVSLRNGRQLVEAEKPKAKSKSSILHEEEDIMVEKDESETPEPVIEASATTEPILEADVPFPNALKSTRWIENDKDIYKTFRKCEVNIPFLDLLKSVPRYAKFLKELYTVKRQKRLKGAQKVKLSGHVSAMFQ
ncbi:uncharacterized protein LOC141631349 [Silene latifolia]|uniref:uncharacterized protein LOC141631349 n=1 Tax=Silene latifolia TaxID=37657 RepID=UPI003D777409